MKLREMIITELIHEAKKRQHSNVMSDYMAMYSEMLRRLEDINVTLYE